jgi:hypothetical protein
MRRLRQIGRVGDDDFVDCLTKISTVVRDESIRARPDGGRKMNRVGGLESVVRAERNREIRSGFVDGKKIQAAQKCRKGSDLGIGPLADWLREDLR